MMKYHVLCENHLFQKVYQKKNRASGKTVTVYVLKDLHAARLKKENPMKVKINRVGISVSKKVGNAVKRNRAKRIIREAFRQLEKEHPLKKGKLIVMVARGDRIDRKKTADVYADLKYCFEKLEMYEEIT